MIQKQKKKTWAWFSKYIRLKYSDQDGMCECYTCGRKMKWNDKNCQAGHGIGGRTNSVLFEEDIVRVQCYGCNVCQYGKLDEFGAKLRNEIGIIYDHILKGKHEVKIFTELELKEMEETYKRKAKELAQQKCFVLSSVKTKTNKPKYKKSTVILAKLYPNRKKSKEVLDNLRKKKYIEE